MLNTLQHQDTRIDTRSWLHSPGRKYERQLADQPSPTWGDLQTSTGAPRSTYREFTEEAQPEVLDEAAVGEEITKRLEALHVERQEHGLKIGVWTTFKFLFAALLTSHVRRGFSLQASQTTGHLAVRLLCTELNLSPTTAYRHLDKLKAAGLLDFRSFKIAAPSDWVPPAAKNQESEAVRAPQGPFKRPVLNTGTLIAVRLLPGFLKPVRLCKADFEVNPRDLHSDLQTGNTVTNYTASLTIEQKKAYKARKDRWKKTGHISLPQEWFVDVKVLVDFTLPADWLGKAPLFISVQFSHIQSKASSLRGKLLPEDMFALPDLTPAVAREWIDAIGESIQGYLGDSKGKTVWHDVLWRLYRHSKHGKNRFQYFFDQLSRAKAEFDQRERRNPSASLIRGLRQRENSFWDWLQSAPPHAAR